MADRILVPVAHGLLALDRETYDAALAAGAEFIRTPGPAQSSGTEQLLNADQLAAVLQVPVTWIEQAAREKRIPSLEFGRWRRFRRVDVERAVLNGSSAT